MSDEHAEPDDNKEKGVKEIASQSISAIRGIGQEHGTNTMVLVFVLIMTFALGGFLGWFVGRVLYTSVDSNTAAIKALTTVVNGIRDDLRPAPVQRPAWPAYPQQFPGVPQQAPQPTQPGYRNDGQQTGR